MITFTNNCRVILALFIIGAIICCICCCCCYCVKKYTSLEESVPVQTVRTYDATTASQPVVKIEPFNQPSSSGFTCNTNAPPPYCETCNTNAPPPYIVKLNTKLLYKH